MRRSVVGRDRRDHVLDAEDFTGKRKQGRHSFGGEALAPVRAQESVLDLDIRLSARVNEPAEADHCASAARLTVNMP